MCDIQLGKMLSPASKTGRRPRHYLRNANVQWARFDLDDLAQMDFSEREEAKFSLQPGDVLVCEGGEPGRAAVWHGEIEGCLYQKSLHRLRPKPDAIDSDFLVHRLRFAALRGEFESSHAKTTIAHLPAVRLAELRIKLPPLAEQRRIAGALRDQLNATSLLRSGVEAQWSLVQGLLAAQLDRVFAGPIRDGRRTRLGEVLTRRQEIVHPYDEPSGSAVFVGLEHIQAHTGERVGQVDLDMADLTGRKPRFRSGDIVYGYLRPYLNKVWIADFDGLCSVDQYVYEADLSRVSPGYIAWFMRSPVFLQRAPVVEAPGQLPRIRAHEVASVEIILPPRTIQDRVAMMIDQVAKLAQGIRSRAEAQRADANQLEAAFLRRAFSGEV